MRRDLRDTILLAVALISGVLTTAAAPGPTVTVLGAGCPNGGMVAEAVAQHQGTGARYAAAPVAFTVTAGQAAAAPVLTWPPLPPGRYDVQATLTAAAATFTDTTEVLVVDDQTPTQPQPDKIQIEDLLTGSRLILDLAALRRPASTTVGGRLTIASDRPAPILELLQAGEPGAQIIVNGGKLRAAPGGVGRATLLAGTGALCETNRIELQTDDVTPFAGQFIRDRGVPVGHSLCWRVEATGELPLVIRQSSVITWEVVR